MGNSTFTRKTTFFLNIKVQVTWDCIDKIVEKILIFILHLYLFFFSMDLIVYHLDVDILNKKNNIFSKNF